MTPQQYRKRSLPNLFVDAVRVTAENAEDVAEWTGGWVKEEIDPFDKSKRQPAVIVTVEYGDSDRASLGDYVFKTTTGDFRVRKPNAFNSIWELNPTKQ